MHTAVLSQHVTTKYMHTYLHDCWTCASIHNLLCAPVMDVLHNMNATHVARDMDTFAVSYF